MKREDRYQQYEFQCKIPDSDDTMTISFEFHDGPDIRKQKQAYVILLMEAADALETELKN